jgi:hypothetical protein
MKSARHLLGVIDEYCPDEDIGTGVLGDGLDVTQPFRHGRVDDEFAVLRPVHIQALIALDQHPALRLLDEVTPDRNVDDLIRLALSAQKRNCRSIQRIAATT